MFQHFIDTTRVNPKTCGNVVLIFPIPVAMPNFDSIIEGQAIGLVILVHRIKLSLCGL